MSDDVFDKRIWELTQSEFVEHIRSRSPDFTEKDVPLMIKHHREAVLLAQELGKVIPGPVLDDYPDFK